MLFLWKLISRHLTGIFHFSNPPSKYLHIYLLLPTPSWSKSPLFLAQANEQDIRRPPQESTSFPLCSAHPFSTLQPEWSFKPHSCLEQDSGFPSYLEENPTPARAYGVLQDLAFAHLAILASHLLTPVNWPQHCSCSMPFTSGPRPALASWDLALDPHRAGASLSSRAAFPERAVWSSSLSCLLSDYLVLSFHPLNLTWKNTLFLLFSLRLDVGSEKASKWFVLLFYSLCCPLCLKQMFDKYCDSAKHGQL